MKVCLIMKVEGALWELYHMCGVDLHQQFVEIIQGWKNENYLGMVNECNLMIDEIDGGPAFNVILMLDVRVEPLLEATVEHLENRVGFDLAVCFHQHSGGERCHLRDLRFTIHRDRLE